MKTIKRKKIILLITLISCSYSNKKSTISPITIKISNQDSVVLTENYIKLCYGIETGVDTNNVMEHAIQLLNTSDYKGCLDLFKRRYNKVDTVRWHSGFYGLIVPDSNIQSYHNPDMDNYNPLNYLSFRYNNFIGDLSNDEQSLIMDAVGKTEKPNELFKLHYVEIDMISYDKSRFSDTTIAIRTIKDAEYLEKKYPKSKWLEYILGTSYLVLGQDSKAIPLFDKLISQNYYALPCLKKIINYLGAKERLSEQSKYLSIFRQMFPEECILSEQFTQLSTDSIRDLCKKCIEKGTQRDSIQASIFLAKYFFNIKYYSLLDSLVDIYYREHNSGSKAGSAGAPRNNKYIF